MCTNKLELIVLHLTCWGKIPIRVTALRFELTSQRRKVSRFPNEPPGRPPEACYYCQVIHINILEVGNGSLLLIVVCLVDHKEGALNCGRS